MKLQGVKTTGIYCRADCGASPRPKNVQPVSSAIAAMAAGFRPCLVCRPDQLPEFGLDQPAPEVAHSVRLIAEGFLDEANTEQLAERVGYSTRHLVRLFEKHIGASPDFVARARRAHLARRLLDETNLSITDVVFASGFSSVRQMNRVVKDLFAFSPSALRKKRKRDAELDPLDGGLRLRIPFEGRLNIRRIVEYLCHRSIPGVETVQDDCYMRTMNVCGHAGVIEVCGSEGQHLNITMHLPTFGSIVDHIERARSLFGINRKNDAATRHLRKDKWIGQLIRRQPGLQMPGAWNRFETAIRIIFGQQVSVSGASTLTGRLVERLGQPIEIQLPGSLQYLFPSAKTIAAADLSDLGIPGSRAKTIQRFSAAVAMGEVDLAKPDSLDNAVDSLTQIPGIGPWTAHFIAGRVLGNEDAFPASDLGLRRSISLLMGKSQTMSAAEIESLAENWRPYRFTAATFLWMSDEEKLNQFNVKSKMHRRKK